MEENGIRINKYLSEVGVCSRREADKELEAGKIKINGVIAKPGDRVKNGDTVTYCDKPVKQKDVPVLLAMYKPVGIVCTAEKREKNNIIDYLNYETRVYPVGRLDKDSEGLILLTNQGELSNEIQKARNYHEKEYRVTVHKAVSDSFLRGMAGGVPLVELETTTRKCKVEKLGHREFSIVLTQGLNRQIRRMCEYFGYHVVSLKRVRVMNIELGDLKPGEYRVVTGEEYDTLLKQLNLSDKPKKAEQKKKREFTSPKEHKVYRVVNRANTTRKPEE